MGLLPPIVQKQEPNFALCSLDRKSRADAQAVVAQVAVLHDALLKGVAQSHGLDSKPQEEPADAEKEKRGMDLMAQRKRELESRDQERNKVMEAAWAGHMRISQGAQRVSQSCPPVMRRKSTKGCARLTTLAKRAVTVPFLTSLLKEAQVREAEGSGPWKQLARMTTQEVRCRATV
jgi:hypothetical protein